MAEKRKSTLCVLLVILSLGNSCGGRLPSSIKPVDNNPGGADRRQLLVKRKLTTDTSSSSISAASTNLIVKIAAQDKVKTIKSLGVEVVSVPESTTILKYMSALEKDPTVEYVEPNHVRKVNLIEETIESDNNVQSLKDDIAKNQINSLVNHKGNSVSTFQSMFNDPDIKLQYGLDNINAEKAWGTTKGDDTVIVAVVDSGVDLHHPDLAANLVNGYTAVKGTTSPNDDNGHGTHVSGVIAAIANNGVGVTGLAPKCKIMPVKVLSAKGDGNDSDIAEGIVWAVDHGANVINLSLGGVGAGKTLENAMLYAYNSNVLVLAAMGNNGKKLKNYPAAYKNVIAVGATDIKNKIAPFSNYGEWISVSAPGLKIHSTFPTYKVELSRYNLPTSYAILSGTSMAVPFVSALAALIISKNKGINRADVRKKIEQTTLDIDAKGFDESSGFGLIDAYKAVNK